MQGYLPCSLVAGSQDAPTSFRAGAVAGWRPGQTGQYPTFFAYASKGVP